MKTLPSMAVLLLLYLTGCMKDDPHTFELSWADNSVDFPYSTDQVRQMTGKNISLSPDFYNDPLLLNKKVSYVSTTYEVSTNDSAEASAWVSAEYRSKRGNVRFLVREEGSSGKYFQYTISPTDSLSFSTEWYRVHRLSYIDRSMFLGNEDLLKAGPIGLLRSVPITIDTLLVAARYLYLVRPAATWGYNTADERIILDAKGGTGDSLRYILYQSVRTDDDEPGTMLGDTVTTYYDIYQLIFTADRNTGLITFSRKRIRCYVEN